MRNIYMCLVVALLQFSLLEAKSQVATSPNVPARPLIYKYTPIKKNPIRARRDLEENAPEDLAQVSQDDLYREERSLQPHTKDYNPIKPHILINRPSPTIPEHEIRFRREASETSKRFRPDIGLIRALPIKDDILIYRPTFPKLPKSEIRFRREVGDEDQAVEDQEGQIREKRFAPGDNKFPGPRGGQQQDRGSWGVSVNKDKGRGPQVHTQGQGNIYTSPNGNWKVDAQGHHEFGKGRKPEYGGGVTVNGRWRRDVSEDNEHVEAEEETEDGQSRIKRFAPGENNFPKSSGGQQQDRGSWGVTVNKDKGRGPQVNTQGQGNIYTSPKGNVRVDGHGHHEFGKGRKPSYGGGVNVHGKWKREVSEDNDENTELEDDDESGRIKRFAPGENNFPKSSGGQQQDRGSWGVTVNKDKGRGPQVNTQGQGNIYTSPKGNVKVDGHGHHEFGKGRKPSYGGGVNVHGKWKREVSENEEEIQEDTEDLREKRQTRPVTPLTRPYRPDILIYRPSPTFPIPEPKTRFRRDVEDFNTDDIEEDLNREKRFAPGGNSFPGSQGGQRDRGSWDVNVNKDKGRGPQVHTQGQGNIYTSPKGNVKVDAHGHHEFGKGRKPDYGGGVSVHGKWKREADDLGEIAEEMTDDVDRVRREANPQKDRGSVGVNVERGPNGGAQVRTDANYNLYRSRNGNWEVNGNAHHQAGRGQKPSYGGGVSVTGRFRRDVDDENVEEEVEGTERVRREANPQRDSTSVAKPQQNRGSIGVNVERGPFGGPQVRTDANYNMYRSRNGNWEVNGNAYHQAGRGQKPSYGGGVTLTGRFRRDVDDGNVEEEVEGTERVRREANPQRDSTAVSNPQRNRGSIGVNVERGPFGGPQVRTDANYNLYRSRNGNWEVNGNAHHQAGRGQKPSYGGGVTLTGRF